MTGQDFIRSAGPQLEPGEEYGGRAFQSLGARNVGIGQFPFPVPSACVFVFAFFLLRLSSIKYLKGRPSIQVELILASLAK